MAVFPRAAKARSRLATPPRFPGALQSWGTSGKGQVRSVQSMGRTWQETYPVLDTAEPAVRALLEAINRSLRTGVLWDVQHPYLHRRIGLGGGTPLVNGASQTGSSINIDGASNGIVGWLKQGDIISITGCPVVFDVTEDVTTSAGGAATIPINPPIFTGQSPADNATVVIDPTAIFYKAYIVEVSDLPLMDTTRFLDAGLTITWREQPV